MALVRNANNAVSAVDGATGSSGSFNPRRDETLLLFLTLSDCVVERPVLTTSIAGVGQIEFVTSVVFGPSIHTLYLYVTTVPATTISARTFSFDCSPTTATGFSFGCVVISGLFKTGLALIRQTAVTPNGAGGVAPETNFPAASLTTSTVLCGFSNLAGGAPGLATGAVLTLLHNTGYTPPNIGYENAYRSGGFAAQQLLYGATSATSWGAIGVELDGRAYTSDDSPRIEAGIGV